MRVEPVSPNVERAALEFLERSPYDYVFLSYLLRHDFSNGTRSRIYVASDDASNVKGLAYYGRQIALASAPDAAAAFAQQARKHRGDRMLLGPRATIDAYWPLVQAWHAPPRAVVADNSARMIAGELDYDPRRRSPEYAPNIRQMIDQRLWWVGEHLGRLIFFCNIGPWCAKTLQLQGIWMPPEYRGKGLATAAFGGICNVLLDVSPTLSLYVNDFNEAAVALYRRVGFETVSEYKTLLF
jgi:RimJ/RimL family protein N-acetyltransferase